MKTEIIKTPYFVIDKEVLDEGLKKLRKALGSAWGNYIIGYSYKTNALPWLINYFKERGCYAEVVSDDEYALAQSIGIENSHFIYNGIAKSKESFIEAVKNHAIVNIDAEYEIEWLDELKNIYSNEETYSIGIRVNFDLESRCPGAAQFSEDGGRFGFCYENGELKRAIDRITSKGVRIAGIHLHKSSKTRMPNVYKAIAEVAVEVGKEYKLDLSYIDIGGGFFGGLDFKPQFPEYFDTVAKILKSYYKSERTTLIVEPGNALIASPIDYITTVKDVKRTKKAVFVVTDGSRTQIDPLMTKKSYFYDINYCESIKERKKVARQVITGFTCMESDRLFEIDNSVELVPGDKVVYHKVGAYTMCLTPLFIKWFPNVYLKNVESFSVVRNKWTAEEYMNKSMKDTTDLKVGYSDVNQTNILLLSVGTRNKIVQYFRENFNKEGYKVYATDVSDIAPALYDADEWFLDKRMADEGYLEQLLDFCEVHSIKGVLSLIDPELSVLAENVKKFQAIGTTVIGSSYELCEMALDKMEMYKWLKYHNYNCARSWKDKEAFYEATDKGEVSYPVFIKPYRGSASISISKVYDKETVDLLFSHEDDLMIQEFLNGQEIGADVYIDMISGEVVSIFTKKKLKMRAGETDKAVSFKNQKLFELIERFATEAGFRGQIDIDIFDIDGQYYISEVNPRFGGGYPHAYECGCNHMKMILENLKGNVNAKCIGNYEDGIYMMKYNEVKKR